MRNQIDITIKAPPLPEGYELYTGEGVPPAPYAALSHYWYWFIVDGGIVISLAYAIPIATPEEALIEAVRGYIKRLGIPGKDWASDEYRALFEAFEAWQKMAGEL
jgi:hypothetical protein